MDKPKRRCSYPWFLVKCYWLVLLITFIIAVGCTVAAVLLKDLPELDDPIKGFHSRGTEIKGREFAIDSLFSNDVTSSYVGNPLSSLAVEERKKRQIENVCSSQAIASFSNDDRLVKLAFAAKNSDNLWTPEAVKEMCEFDRRLVLNSEYVRNRDCPSHSIGYYVGLRRNKRCEEINEDDLTDTMQLLKRCADPYYEVWEAGNADECFSREGCQSCSSCLNVPAECYSNDNAAIRIIHYLTDSKFIGHNHRNNEKLANAIIITNLMYNEGRDFYINQIHNKDLEGTFVKVVGMDAEKRFPIFNYYLFQDMIFFIVAMCLIILAMILYLRSVLITIFTLLDVILSFGLAYFIYVMVFGIPHLPFLSFLTILLLIAIGADDVFIFCDTFETMKRKYPDGDLVTWISKTLQHAALSILVTSLTTGAALYANVISEITDIKAFGIISGTSLVMNYLLMVTWIPSAVIMIEKIDNCCFGETKCCGCYRKFLEILRSISIKIFHDILPFLVKKLWFIWLFLFLGLGIGGIIVTFVKPKLDLPQSQDFALFTKDNVLEVWFQKLKYNFRFYQLEDEERLGSGIELLVAWGVDDKDTGNHLDPDSVPDFKLDSSFDLSSVEAQLWMLEFCHDLKNASFIDKTSVEFRKCSIEELNDYLTKSCSDLNNEILNSFGIELPSYLSDCCGRTETPVQSSVFKKCYYYLTSMLSANAQNYMGVAHWKRNTADMKAYTIQFTSNQAWLANFAVMDPFYKEVQDWMKEKLKSAPGSLRNGWIAARWSNFDLYDLQRSLASGTYAAIGVSMAAAFCVMLVTSLNVLITLYAIFTIFLTISCSAGVLVFAGWELNIVESVTLTMSVGLSIDFCIHYGIGYRLSKLGNRKLRVQDSFEKVGAAVFMAAGTTFLAGSVMMPSVILFYLQLGTFLMLIMASSWLFATFFFQSLCYAIGPQDNFCQIPSPFSLFCTKNESVDNNTMEIPIKYESSPKLNGAAVNVSAIDVNFSQAGGKDNLAYFGEQGHSIAHMFST